MSAVAAGEYVVYASNPSYLGISYGVRRPGGRGTNLVVADGDRLDITLQAWPEASISGHVLDERGRPVVGASVRIIPKEGPAYGSATTDDRGFYRIARLPPGEYAVAVPISGSNRTLNAPQPANASGYTPSLTPYLLDRAARTILVPYGAPLPPPAPDGRANVFVTSYFGGAGLADATYVSLSPSQERSDVDITLAARRGFRVAGIVTVPSGSVNGVILTLTPQGVPDAPLYARLTATAASDGTFVFVAAPEGAYTLSAYRRAPPLTPVSIAGGSPSIMQDDVIDHDPDSLWVESPIAVGGDDADGLVVAMRQGIAVSGRVVFDDQPVLPPGVRLNASLTRGPVGTSFGQDPYLQARPDGSFATKAMPGRYLLQFRDMPQGRSLTSVLLGGREIGDGPIVVGNDPIDDLQIVFSRAGTSVTGMVVDTRGQSAANGTVVVFPIEHDHWDGLASTFGSVRGKTAPLRSGRYEIHGLLPGDYYVAAIDDDLQQDASFAPSLLRRLADRASRVELHAGEPITLNLTIAAAKHP